jgi:lambda family phage minor tail protein L
MTIAQDLKLSALPNYIELFILDLTPIGGSVIRMTPNTVAGTSSISFGGNTYTPMPVTGSGWETSMDGQAPQPTLKISNVTKFVQSYLSTYKDMVGARLTRYQTFDKYLDSGSSPDSSQVFNTCIYVIEQKTKQNKYEVEFKLSSIIDAPQQRLPRQQVLRTEFPGAGLFRKN